MNVWRKIDVNGENYLFKYFTKSPILRIFISDLINLWYEEVEMPELLERTRSMNELIEAEDENFHKKIISMLNTIGSTDILLENEKLNLKSKMSNIQFQIEFNLKSANSQMFFSEITTKLLHSINELNIRQNLLMDVLEKKDLEIKEYQLQGVAPIRKNIETEKFSKITFLSERLNESKSMNLDLFSAFISNN